MKNKERYELLDYCIYDNNLKEYVCSPSASIKFSMKTLTDLLNQKDNRIKELEEMNKALQKSKEHFKKVAENVVNLLLEKHNIEGAEELVHAMNYELEFYIGIFKHLLQLEKKYCNKTYCNNRNGGYYCSECKFVTEDGICIKNWLLREFDEFVRQAKKEISEKKG